MKEQYLITNIQLPIGSSIPECDLAPKLNSYVGINLFMTSTPGGCPGHFPMIMDKQQIQTTPPIELSPGDQQSRSLRLLAPIITFILGKDRLARREAVWGYLFMLPWLCGFLLLTLGPFIVSAVMSFYQWRGFGKAKFVGFYNYEWILTNDRLFRKALEVTVSYALLIVPLGILLAFLVALLLSHKLVGVEVLRAMFYLPSVVTGVAVAFMWMYIFDPQNGPLNILLQNLFGLDKPIPWLSSPDWTLPSFVLMSLWGFGGSMIILLAGLKGIPRHLYEAAIIDGASALTRLRTITIPMLSPSLFYVLIILTISSFQVITAPLVIYSESNGPLNSALFYSLYLYRTAFTLGRMGYGSALAWILFVLILTITLINFFAVGRHVYYEE